MKPTVIDPKTTTRAAAFDLWMNAPNPMVTFFKTLDVTPLVRLSRKRGLKFNMLLCWCIGKAASGIKGKQNAIDVKIDENNIYTFNVISPEAQIQTLEESAFPVLDSIRDQAQLVRQIAQLDIASGETVRWNDMEKLAPYLKSGDLKSAEKVLRAILQQHQSVCSHSPLPEVVDSICKEDRAFIQKLEWVEREDWKSINAYLERNKERNNRFARNIRPR